MELSSDRGSEMNGTSIGNGAVTDADSKTVMLAAERGDSIRITEIVSRRINCDLPDVVEVLRRSEPYYGPKIFALGSVNDEERNFILTAPGPGSQLMLWMDDIATNGKRRGWVEAAEVTASLAVEQPPYERCSECGEIIRSIEHERAALSGQCSRKESWD